MGSGNRRRWRPLPRSRSPSKTIAARCESLGIPARFAPTVEFSWRGRGENAIAKRRAELRAVAKSRIAAIEKAAITQIERGCLDAQMLEAHKGDDRSRRLGYYN